MKFTETPLRGAFLVELEQREDERGFFARTVCEDEFAQAGLNGRFVQQSVSWNPLRGTLRGMHFQKAPYKEDKLVRVTRGAIFDVIADLRSQSETYGKTWAVELRADRHRAIYVPQGFAHGFQTLADGTEVLYAMTTRFHPGSSGGVRWDDPQLAIAWPLPVDPDNRRQISLADLNHPSLAELHAG